MLAGLICRRLEAAYLRGSKSSALVVSQMDILTAQRNSLEKRLSLQKEKLDRRGGGSGSGQIISAPEKVISL